MLREQHALRDLADLMARSADALQPAGHRRRRLHLDDQVDRAHVDAQFEAGGRDDGLQPPGLEVILDQGPLFLADRTVVGAGQQGRCTRREAAAHDVCGRAAAHLRIGPGGQFDPVAFGVNLVEPRGKSFGKPPRVGEHDRAAVRLDQVDDALLDVGPDAVVLEVGHIGYGHLHRQVERLGRGRGDHPRRRLPGQESRDLLRRAHRRRQPDPLRGLVQQLVEPLQRERQMGPALGRGDGVHLVDDDGLHRGERFARGRRQHQEQRLGCGDQDVGRLGDELPSPSGRGVAGAHADADLRGALSAPLGDAGDAGQRRAQVAFDVDGQRLQRRYVQNAGPTACEGSARCWWPGLGGQPVDGPQERGQRLSGSGRRDDQRVIAVGDGRPGLRLCIGRGREGAGEPLPGQRAEPGERVVVRAHIAIVPTGTDKITYLVARTRPPR